MRPYLLSLSISLVSKTTKILAIIIDKLATKMFRKFENWKTNKILAARDTHPTLDKILYYIPTSCLEHNEYIVIPTKLELAITNTIKTLSGVYSAHIRERL